MVLNFVNKYGHWYNTYKLLLKRYFIGGSNFEIFKSREIVICRLFILKIMYESCLR